MWSHLQRHRPVKRRARRAWTRARCLGATGSYSKKYALNNLFAIDDNKDADDDGGSITTKQIAEIEALIGEVKADKKKFLAYLKIEKLGDLTPKTYGKAIAALEAKRK